MSGPATPPFQPQLPHENHPQHRPPSAGYPPQGAAGYAPPQEPQPGYGFAPPGPPPRRKSAGAIWAVVGGVVAVVVVVGAAFYLLGPGKSKRSGGSASSKGWAPGDVRTVTHDGVCKPIAGLAARMVPKADPQVPPSTRTDIASCHWANVGLHNNKHFRSLAVRVEPSTPTIGVGSDGQSADEVAKNGFRQTVQQNQGGSLGEKNKDSHSVPGIGGEAAITYGVGTTDAGVAHLIIRVRNVGIDITYQGSENSLRGSPTGGYYPVSKPLSARVAEQGALAIGRRVAAEFR